MRSALVLVVTLLVGCGGRVVDDGRGSADGLQGFGETEPGEDAGGAADAAKSAPTDAAQTPPKPEEDSAPAPREDTAPPVVDGTPGDLPVDCSAGPATGPLMGGCGSTSVCSAGDSVDLEWAQAMLSCYVDRCLGEQGRGAWCGEIGLTFGADGCTTNYVEGGNSGGCVKYQGYYRRWPCLAGKTISVTRPCN